MNSLIMKSGMALAILLSGGFVACAWNPSQCINYLRSHNCESSIVPARLLVDNMMSNHGSLMRTLHNEDDSFVPSAVVEEDDLSQYRDTIVGKFNGVDVDTLICEPIGKRVNDELFGEFYIEWRVYSVRGTVDEFKIGNTIGIDFVKEGDLDGNKTEEWGFITQWVTSMWTGYNIFTVSDGRCKLLTEPVIIWLGHLEDTFTENDIARPSNRKGYIQVKSSNVNVDGSDWFVTDTVIPVSPMEYTYDLVKW